VSQPRVGFLHRIGTDLKNSSRVLMSKLGDDNGIPGILSKSTPPGKITQVRISRALLIKAERF
jgi:hypothetical protein